MNEIVVTIVCHDRIDPVQTRAQEQARQIEEACLQATARVLGIHIIVDGIGAGAAPPQVYAGVRTS